MTQGVTKPEVRIEQTVKTAEGFDVTPTGSMKQYLSRMIELLEEISEKLDDI